MNQYGPALVLGLLIGGAILLDDVITPRHPNPTMMIEAHPQGPVPLIRKEMRIGVSGHDDMGPHKKISIQKNINFWFSKYESQKWAKMDVEKGFQTNELLFFFYLKLHMQVFPNIKSQF